MVYFAKEIKGKSWINEAKPSMKDSKKWSSATLEVLIVDDSHLSTRSADMLISSFGSSITIILSCYVSLTIGRIALMKTSQPLFVK